MQPYTAATQAVLTGPNVTWSFGCDLLDSSLTWVLDLSPQVKACTVSRDCTAVVHGSVDLTLAWQLQPTDRVRPWIAASNGLTTVPFDLGVYLPTTPTAQYGTTPLNWQVVGHDVLSLLDKPLAQPWTTATGAVVFTEIARLLTAAGVTAPLLLDSTSAAATFTPGKTWPVASGTTWMTVLNGLLTAIGYGGIWADWNGALRSSPFIAAASRPAEWAFIVGDPVAGILTDNPTVANPIYETPNQFIYVMNGIDGDPVDGVSRIVIDNLTTGPSSQTALGQINQAPTVSLDAVDFTSLSVAANADAAAQIRATETVTTTGRKLPVAWHNDVVTYLFDALGDQLTLQGRSWSLALHDLSPMQYVWEKVSA